MKLEYLDIPMNRQLGVILSYLKDSHAAEHSAVSDIFYTQKLIYSTVFQDLALTFITQSSAKS